MTAYTPAPLARDDWRFDAKTGEYRAVQFAPMSARAKRAGWVISTSLAGSAFLGLVVLMVIGAVR